MSKHETPKPGIPLNEPQPPLTEAGRLRKAELDAIWRRYLNNGSAEAAVIHDAALMGIAAIYAVEREAQGIPAPDVPCRHCPVAELHGQPVGVPVEEGERP